MKDLNNHWDIIQALVNAFVFTCKEGITCMENTSCCVWVSSDPQEISEASKVLSKKKLLHIKATSKKHRSFLITKTAYLPTLIELKHKKALSSSPNNF